MLKSNRGLGVHFNKVSLILLTVVFLGASLLPGCGNASDSTDKEAEGPLPVIFIPGIQGSVLVNETNLILLWPPGGLEGSISLSRFEAQFKELSLKPPPEAHPKVFANDVIRTYGGEPFYDSFLKFLTNPKQGGYVEYDVDYAPERRTLSGIFTGQKIKPSLFVFAYDWRLPIEENANKLAEYVEVVAQFYHGKKVNIVTHSMGGLVARRYIIDHPDRVNKLITVAAPWLGAAKPLYQMIYGKITALSSITASLEGAKALGKDWFMEGYFGNDGKEMMDYFPGVHELMASGSYHALGHPSYYIYDTINDAAVGQTYKEVMGPGGIVDSLFKNEANVGDKKKKPAQTNWDFHEYISANGNKQDDWSRDNTGVKYYHLIGVQDSNDTPWAVLQSVAIGRNYELYEPGPGDGTVPLLSSARIKFGINLNAPGAKLFIYTGGKLDLNEVKSPAVTIYTGNSDEFLEHTGIMKNPDVMAKVLELLREEEKPIVTTPPPATNTTTPKAVPAGKWVLAEAKLPTYDPKPQMVNNSLGTHEMTRVISESEISWLTRTLDKQGREVGTSRITLKIDKPPAELPRTQKVEWRVTWEITTTGTPVYTSSYIELRQGEFQGKLEPIRLAENPKGSMTFAWDVPGSAASSNLDRFEISAKLTIPGGLDTVVWTYRLKKD